MRLMAATIASLSAAATSGLEIVDNAGHVGEGRGWWRAWRGSDHTDIAGHTVGFGDHTLSSTYMISGQGRTKAL
jgi:hypothetical protein